MNFERRYFDSKIRDGKPYRISPSELRYMNVKDFENGDTIFVGNKYEIELVDKGDGFFIDHSRVLNPVNFKYIDPFFWPVYIRNFLHGEYKRR